MLVISWLAKRDDGDRVAVNQHLRIHNFVDSAVAHELGVPEWHHIFPKKFLAGRYEDVVVNALASIAIIEPETNRLSAKDPMEYLEKYNVTVEKLGQQFINEDSRATPVEKLGSFLQHRATILAQKAHEFLGALHNGIDA